MVFLFSLHWNRGRTRPLSFFSEGNWLKKVQNNQQATSTNNKTPSKKICGRGRPRSEMGKPATFLEYATNNEAIFWWIISLDTDSSFLLSRHNTHKKKRRAAACSSLPVVKFFFLSSSQFSSRRGVNRRWEVVFLLCFFPGTADVLVRSFSSVKAIGLKKNKTISKPLQQTIKHHQRKFADEGLRGPKWGSDFLVNDRPWCRVFLSSRHSTHKKTQRVAAYFLFARAFRGAHGENLFLYSLHDGVLLFCFISV